MTGNFVKPKKLLKIRKSLQAYFYKWVSCVIKDHIPSRRGRK